MIDIKQKKDCCGCYGCVNVCPKQCIDMKIDSEGFWYPEVDKIKCINCSLCEQICTVMNQQMKEKFNTIAYACKNKDEKVRMSSSSGGIFTNLCEYVINNNGVVFGAAFNNNFEVTHMKATTLEECKMFKGSKYVQSKIGRTYEQAKKYLDEGKIVLFSGTQCQIKGLNSFLRKQYPNLISVDVICHGVPSPLVFDMYKQHLIKNYKSDITEIGFRDKSSGWKQFSFITKFKNGKTYLNLLNKDIYMIGFLKNIYLRPSCYNCKAKNFSSNSDISLADYWGITNKHREFDDDKGISLVLVNSKQGEFALNNIAEFIEIIKTDIDYAIYNNPCIIRPVKYNKKRKIFFKDMDKRDLENNIKRCTYLSIVERIKIKIISVLWQIKNDYKVEK